MATLARSVSHLDEGHVLLGDGAVARVKVRLVEEKVVDVEAPRETDLVILQNWPRLIVIRLVKGE